MGAPEPSADVMLEAADPDCCVGAAESAPGAPGVPAQAASSPAPALLAQAESPSPVATHTSEARASAARPPEIHTPLYRLHSSLLI